MSSGEHRNRALPSRRRQPAWSAHRVVAQHVGGVGDFLERVSACLAGLELDEIERLFLARQQQVVHAQQYRRA